MREKTVEQTLVREVKNRGGVCWKWISPSMTGVPDRICIFPGGRVIFVELKRPGLKGNLSEKQKWVHKILKDLGCTVLVLSSNEEVADAISSI